MTFDEWWGTLTTREQARMVKDDVAEAWQAAFQDGYEKGIAAFHEAVKVEREACAKVCEEFGKEWMCPHTTDEIATLIRRRFNAEVSGAGTASAGLPGYTSLP